MVCVFTNCTVQYFSEPGILCLQLYQSLPATSGIMEQSYEQLLIFSPLIYTVLTRIIPIATAAPLLSGHTVIPHTMYVIFLRHASSDGHR